MLSGTYSGLRSSGMVISAAPFRKDATLDRLAGRYNVAQFVSFAPSPTGPLQQFAWVRDRVPNEPYETPAHAVADLLAHSPDGSVNVRSFSETESQSREFIYGLHAVDDVVQALTRLSGEGAFTIVNETVDVSDGGVSGVALGPIIEFRPDDTPRGVEREGFAALPRAWAERAFRIVYGIALDLDVMERGRTEFSLHPRPRGYRHSHVLCWEHSEHDAPFSGEIDVRWPNSFSRMLGDKAYGLLVAHLAGASVPRTTVVGRRVAPFSFGRTTGSSELWIRTCPMEQVPGKFTTARGWRDPFRLLASEDPGHELIASVLSQEGVNAKWSGAAIEGADGRFYVEGVCGTGEDFMQGATSPAPIPTSVVNSVRRRHRQLARRLGSVRFEWVHDGARTWIVQLHGGRSVSSGKVIVPGEARNWVDFHVESGLTVLRNLLTNLPKEHGVRVVGGAGLAGHVADVLRKASIPSVLAGAVSSDVDRAR